jgi:hypothetical protein
MMNTMKKRIAKVAIALSPLAALILAAAPRLRI